VAVELWQLLFDQTPHEIGVILEVNTVPEAAFEAAPIEQGHEELEVLLPAVMGRGG
jgi:hypothetical protein